MKEANKSILGSNYQSTKKALNQTSTLKSKDLKLEIEDSSAEVNPEESKPGSTKHSQSNFLYFKNTAPKGSITNRAGNGASKFYFSQTQANVIPKIPIDTGGTEDQIAVEESKGLRKRSSVQQLMTV